MIQILIFKTPKPSQTLGQDIVSDLLDYLVGLIAMDFG